MINLKGCASSLFLIEVLFDMMEGLSKATNIFMIADVPAEIQAKHPLNSSLQFYQ
jgi:hypothetical protein